MEIIEQDKDGKAITKKLTTEQIMQMVCGTISTPDANTSR